MAVAQHHGLDPCARVWPIGHGQRTPGHAAILGFTPPNAVFESIITEEGDNCAIRQLRQRRLLQSPSWNGIRVCPGFAAILGNGHARDAEVFVGQRQNQRAIRPHQRMGPRHPSQALDQRVGFACRCHEALPKSRNVRDENVLLFPGRRAGMVEVAGDPVPD